MEQLHLREAILSDCGVLSEAFERSASFLKPWSFCPENIERYISQQNVYLLLMGDDLVGVFSVSGITRGLFQSAYLGYNVFVPHNNKGHMSMGIKMLIHEMFENKNLHRLEANIQPQNYASLKFVANAGFHKEGFSKNYLRIGGEWRDHERWAILNDHWRPLDE